MKGDERHALVGRGGILVLETSRMIKIGIKRV